MTSFNYQITIAYNGTSYQGWQQTLFGNSIEKQLEQSLYQITQQKISFQAASRTDAGVHAEGQVVNFLLEEPISNLNRFLHSLNGTLPKDIRALSITEQPIHFHPTLNALSKLYTYWICNEPAQLPFYRELSWHYPYPLNLQRMEQGITYLLGTHDFSCFCNERHLWTRSPICTLESITIQSPPIPFAPPCYNQVRISIKGDHFLYKMVRNLVGTLAYIGSGTIPLEQLPIILESRDRTLAGITAPSHGLRLTQVNYARSC
jgi:tRNA pseudouridine38-40 synthase